VELIADATSGIMKNPGEASPNRLIFIGGTTTFLVSSASVFLSRIGLSLPASQYRIDVDLTPLEVLLRREW